MVKTQEKSNQSSQKENKNIFAMVAMVLLLGLVVAYLLAERLGVVPTSSSTLTWSEQSRMEGKIDNLTSQMLIFQNELSSVRRETQEKVSPEAIAALNQKIEDKARLNSGVLDGKASSAAVLSLEARVESLEARMAQVSKFSSQGALVLSAALMVKEAADEGRPYVYEAEVLRLLSKGTNLENEALEMSKYAEKGLLTSQKLVALFNEIDAKEKEPKPEPENKDKSWKDKITEKLGALVTIEYDSTPQTTPEDDEVYKLVNSGRFSEAAVKMKNSPKYQAAAYQPWLQAVEDRNNFLESLQKIKSLALAEMKAESVKALSH